MESVKMLPDEHAPARTGTREADAGAAIVAASVAL